MHPTPPGYGRPVRGVHPAIEPLPGNRRRAELALRIQRDIDNGSGELLALTANLHRSAARQNAAPAPAPSSSVTRMARSGV